MSENPAPSTAPPAGAAAPSATAAGEAPSQVSQFFQLWHDPDDEPHGLVFAVQEIFPEPLVKDLASRVGALPAAIRLAPRAEADRALRILVGLLGCVRGNVCDAAHEALAAVGPDALPVLDQIAARGFGYVVDQSQGRNTLELFGERLVWEKMVKKTAMRLDPKRGNFLSRLLLKLTT